MDIQEYKEIMERLDFIEFRQDLIFSGSELDRSIYEYRLTKKQYTKIMDLMDEYRRKIENNESCSHAGLETQIYKIVPEHNGDYHMCEEIVKGFYDEGRWEEVFIKLYGNMPKYSYLRRKE